jgi:hypothetical protein
VKKGWLDDALGVSRPPLACGPSPLGGEDSFFLLVSVQSGGATWISPPAQHTRTLAARLFG